MRNVDDCAGCSGFTLSFSKMEQTSMANYALLQKWKLQNLMGFLYGLYSDSQRKNALQDMRRRQQLLQVNHRWSSQSDSMTQGAWWHRQVEVWPW